MGLFWTLLIFALLCETTLFSLPLILDLIVILHIYKRESWVFVASFFIGIVLDIMQVRPFGHTGLFFIIALFIIFLYERKYETATREFVFFFTLLAGGVYLWIFNGSFSALPALVNSLVAVGLFLLVSSARRSIGR